MLKISKSMQLLIGLALIVVTYLYTSGEDATTSKTRSTKPSSKTAKLPENVKEEDYTKRFASLNEAPQNSFMPVIARATGGKDGKSYEPDAIPQEYAGGEPGWYFTGTAEIDGVKQALVENRSSGNGDFLRVGQEWKRVRITAIGENTMTIVGPNGQPKTLSLSYGVTGQFMANSTQVRPLDPTLRGQIGGANGAVEIAPDGRGNRRGNGASRGGAAQPTADAGAEQE